MLAHRTRGLISSFLIHSLTHTHLTHTSLPSPIPVGCWGTMDECLHGTWLDDGIGLEAHPRTVSGLGTPDLTSTANGIDIFSIFSPGSLAHKARANGARASPCPLVVLSGAEIKEQSTLAEEGIGGAIKGFLFKNMATANKACKKVADVLRQDQSYIVGAVAFVSSATPWPPLLL